METVGSIRVFYRSNRRTDVLTMLVERDSGIYSASF